MEKTQSFYFFDEAEGGTASAETRPGRHVYALAVSKHGKKPIKCEYGCERAVETGVVGPELAPTLSIIFYSKRS